MEDQGLSVQGEAADQQETLGDHNYYQLFADMIRERFGEAEKNPAGTFPEDTLVVYDEEEECPYIDGMMARMPLSIPLFEIGDSQTDAIMNEGFRRSGRFLYQTNCDNCKACEAIRIDVDLFQPNRSQKRALKKGDRQIEVVIDDPQEDRNRVQLFNKHRNSRGLNRQGVDIDEDDYRSFLVDSCLDTFELAYYVESELIGVAICDRAENSISAVYTYYDPDYQALSPGTFSIMKQIDLCKREKRQYLYLGYFVAQSEFMSYKQNFRPHQRLQNGVWQTFA